MDHALALSADVVQSYIDKASPTTEAERRILDEAVMYLLITDPHTIRSGAHFQQSEPPMSFLLWRSRPTPAEAVNPNALSYLVLKELHAAFCTKKKYKSEVDQFGNNGYLLIGAIATHLAAKVPFIAIAVAAALVAALLRLILKMSLNVFCERLGKFFKDTSQELENLPEQEAPKTEAPAKKKVARKRKVSQRKKPE